MVGSGFGFHMIKKNPKIGKNYTLQNELNYGEDVQIKYEEINKFLVLLKLKVE